MRGRKIARPRLGKGWRNRVLCEALEQRILLNGYTFTLVDQGSPTANGSYLSKVLQGRVALADDNHLVINHVIALGDTIILPNTLSYDVGAGAVPLANLGAAGSVTISAGGVVNGASITFTGGNYGTLVPTVSFFGGGGSGASATVTVDPSGVTGFVISNNGNLYTSVPTVSFDNTGTGATTSAAASVSLTTYIDSVKVTNNGSNYDANTTVTFTGGLGPGGVAATGHVNLNLDGTIKSVLVDTPGSGYTATPTLTFADPGGSGSGAAGYGAFGIDHLVITNPGAGYTSAPTVSFSNGGGLGAVINPIIDGVNSITITNGGSGYTAAPGIVISGGGAGTLTIESSALALLPAGQRVNPNIALQESYLAKISSHDGAGIVLTNLSDAWGHSGAAHNISFLGIEISPDNGNQTFTGAFVSIGDNVAQNDVALAPTNFVFDRCYVHGWDDIGANANTALNTNYKSGFGLNAKFVTIQNSYISDIHSTGFDAQCIGGSNGLGNYLIDNNFLEATGENILFGGAVEYVPDAMPTNITVTHNYFFKRLAWDDFDPAWAGVHMDVKNLFELKQGINVLLDSNLMENCWVGADQTAEAIALGPKNQGAASPWTNISFVTITNNVIRNCGKGIALGMGAKTTQGSYTALTMHDIVIRNNLIENLLAGATLGSGSAFEVNIGGALVPGYNVTIDHNTAINVDRFLAWSSTSNFQTVVGSGFTFTNNVAFFGQWGSFTSDGEGVYALNTFGPIASIINGGSGYTAVPMVTFNGGGGTGASATAILNASVSSYSNLIGGSGYDSTPTVVLSDVLGSGAIATATMLSDGTGKYKVSNLTLVNAGSGYTAAPIISFIGGGGTGASATAVMGDDGAGGLMVTGFTNIVGGSGYSLSTAVAFGVGGAGVILTPVMGPDGAGKLKIVSLNIINGGTGYFAAPHVSFVGGGGTGASVTLNISGSIVGFQTGFTGNNPNVGSGYTAAPTIQITGGGGSAATASTYVYNGSLVGSVFAGNVIIGTPTSKVTNYPNANRATNTNFYNNYITVNEDNVGLLDPAGDQFNILPTIGNGVANPLQNYATDGTNPGVNMAGISGVPDFVQLDSTLLNYWKFDEGAGSTANDSGLGTHHVGTLNGTATWGNATVNTGLVLSGGNTGSVLVGSFSTTANFSFVAWVKSAGMGATQYIASAANNAFSLYIDSTGHLSAKGTNATIIADTATLSTARWYLVGVTYSNGTLTLYRNVPDATTCEQYMTAVAGTASSSTTAGTTILYIGGNQGSVSSFNGTIDEVKYYSSALTGNVTYVSNISQMQALYNGYAPVVDNLAPGSGNKQNGATTTFTAYGLAHGDSMMSTTTRLPPSSVYYTWSAIGPGTVTWSVTGGTNGTNVAQQATASWGAAGNYMVILNVTDLNGTGASTTIYHPMTVVQTPQNVAIDPASPSVVPGGTVQFTRLGGTVDQFGNPLTGTWVWAVAGGGAGGTIDANGLYTAPATGGTDTVQLKYDDVNGPASVVDTATVTITSDLPAVPNVPTISGVTASTLNTSILLTWADTSTGVTGYNIERSSDGGSSWVSVATDVTTTSYTDTTGLAGNTSYVYRVNAYFTVGNNSAWSDISNSTLTIPAIPGGVSATANSGALSILLSWSEGGNGAGNYLIQRSGDNGASWSIVAAGVTGTSYTDSTGLTTSTSYLYRVNAVNATGSSGWSGNSNSALTIPAVPSGLTALAGAGEVVLAWSADVSKVQGFNIQRGTDGVNFTFLTSVDTSQLNYQDAATIAGTKYYYYITAYNATGNSVASNTASSKNAIPGDATLDGKVTGADYTIWADNYGKPGRSWTTGDFTGDGLVTGADYTIWADHYGATAPGWSPLVVPTNVTATPSATALSVGLTWVELGGVRRTYAIRRSANGGGTWTTIATALTVRNYTDAVGLSNNTGYVYEVDATDVTGTTAWSVASNTALTMPAVPTAVTATANSGAQSVNLSWSEAGGATSYAIQRSADGGATWTLVTSGLVGTLYTDATGLTGNTTFIYQVDATNTTATTAWSASSNAALTVPDSPTGFTATGGASSIVLNWTSNTNEANYTLRRSADGGSSWTVLSTTIASTDISYTDSTAIAGPTYLYGLAATNATGSSAYVTATANILSALAYEGFNYTSVADWNGGNSGTGFAGTWSVSNTSKATVGSGSLAYSGNGHGLTTSGNYVTLSSGASATQTLNKTIGIGTSVPTVWVSFLMSSTGGPTGPTGSISVGSSTGTNYVNIGILSNNMFTATGKVDGASYTANSQLVADLNTTYFIVCEIQYLVAGDILTIWVNPDPGGTSPANSAGTGTKTLPAASQLAAANTIVVTGTTTAVDSFDELRIGESYEVVAPDPPVPVSGAQAPVALNVLPGNAGVLSAPDVAEAAPSVSELAFLSTSPQIRTVQLDLNLKQSGYHTHDHGVKAKSVLLIGESGEDVRQM